MAIDDGLTRNKSDDFQIRDELPNVDDEIGMGTETCIFYEGNYYYPKFGAIGGPNEDYRLTYSVTKSGSTTVVDNTTMSEDDTSCGKSKQDDGGDAAAGGHGKAKDGGGDGGAGKDKIGDDTDTTTEMDTTTETGTTTTTTTVGDQVNAIANGFSIVGVIGVLGILSVALLFRREK
jgi:hypothetical protein